MKWCQHSAPASRRAVARCEHVGSRVSRRWSRDINQPVASAAVAGQLNPKARPFRGSRGCHLRDERQFDLSLAAGLGYAAFLARPSLQASYTFSRSFDNDAHQLLRGLSRTRSSFDRRTSWRSFTSRLRRSQGLTRKALFGCVPPALRIRRAAQHRHPRRPRGRGGGAQRPDAIAPVTADKQLARVQHRLVRQSGARAGGGAGRDLIRGPGTNNWDVSFIKRIDLT